MSTPHHPRVAEGHLRDGAWYKATASSNSGGCVEIAHLADGQVALRHSRHPDREPHIFTAHEWACFLDGAKNGEFDPPHAACP